MKLLITCLSLFLFSFITSFADKVNKEDIRILTGAQWKGLLTYLDYSSKERTSIPANLLVKQSEKDPHVFYFFNEYPKEPHANNIDTVTVSRDGKQLNHEKVIRKDKIANIIELVTESHYGENDDLKIYRYTYLIGSNLFSIRKEEKGTKDTGFFVRNVYEYQRK